MAYRNLTFRSLATDIRTETYLGEEHLVIPCIALVGDEVVYGMNAEGPEFIPAEELAFSTLGWSGRPVLYDHPSNSTSTANEPTTLESMSFGQVFYPRFEDNKLKVEAWCNKQRAKEIGQQELISRIESGELIELSIGAIVSIEKRKGTAPNGKPYTAIWHDIQSDHLAIGLSGSQGACNIEMGCGANRALRANVNSDDNDDHRTMRSLRGDEIMLEKQTETDNNTKANNEEESKPKSLVRKILSHASRVFRSNADDEGLSDFELRSKLWDILFSVEPAFTGIEDVFNDSKTVRYITQPTYPEHKMYLWRRTFNVAEDGVVTVNDDREEVDFAVTYIYLSGKVTAHTEQPCGCRGQTVSANETDNPTQPDQPKEIKTMADAKPNDKTVTTPEAGSSEAATPSQSGSEDKTGPNYPAGQTNPTQTDTDSNPVSKDGKPLTEDEQIDKLPSSLKAMVKRYQAQERAERDSLVGALTKKQKVYSKAQLEAKSVDELRQIAELVGIGAQASGDFSGRMMVAHENELPPPPDPHGVNKFLKRSSRESAN